MKKPLISIILCTYNSENLIKSCINSILSQKMKGFEIICMDGGSSDKTQEIIRKYMAEDKRVKFVKNPKKLPEGKGYGKDLGFRKAKGKIVGIIDHDNILQDNELFSKVVKIFEEKEKVLGVLAGLKHDKSDDKLIRFISMFGTDPFFAYRSIDYLKNYSKIRKGITEMELFEDNLPITGGNCFFYNLDSVQGVGGYDRDLITVNNLVRNKMNKLFIVENSTKHYASDSFYNYLKKMLFSKAYYKEDSKFNYMPKTKKERREFTKNLFFNILIFPNIIKGIKISNKYRDNSAFLFLPLAFIVTLFRLVVFASSKIKN